MGDDDSPTPVLADMSLRRQTTHQALELRELALAAARRFDAASKAAIAEGRATDAIEAAEDASLARELADEFLRWREVKPTDPVRQGLSMRLTELAGRSLRR